MKNSTFIKSFYFFLVFLTILSFTAEVKAETTYKKLTAQQCDSLIKANKENPEFIILDVRTPNAWAPDHLEGSINRNYYDSDFNAQLAALPRQKMYLVHCQSGGRSAGTVSKMKSLEFDEIYEMNGGMNSWKNAGLPTTSQIAPKLMLVSYEEITGETNTDTVRVTLTNRGNDNLSFTSASFNDVHEITTNFNSNTTLAGAEDYTFFIFHSPGYFDNDSTGITLESNGGELDFSIVFKNGLLQNIKESSQPDFLVYPNPAQNRFSLKTLRTVRNIEISVFTLNGQLMLKKIPLTNSNSINVSNVPNGVYLVQIKNDRQIFTQKLIIQH